MQNISPGLYAGLTDVTRLHLALEAIVRRDYVEGERLRTALDVGAFSIRTTPYHLRVNALHSIALGFEVRLLPPLTELATVAGFLAIIERMSTSVHRCFTALLDVPRTDCAALGAALTRQSEDASGHGGAGGSGGDCDDARADLWGFKGPMLNRMRSKGVLCNSLLVAFERFTKEAELPRDLVIQSLCPASWELLKECRPYLDAIAADDPDLTQHHLEHFHELWRLTVIRR